MARGRRHLVAVLGAATMVAALGATPRSCGTHFVERHVEAGLGYEHAVDVDDPLQVERAEMAAGVAAGDMDGDGFVDLFVTTGNLELPRLYRSRGDGTFEDVSAGSGLQHEGELPAGPLFFDLDDDALLDLFVGGVAGTPARVYRNLGGARFADVTSEVGLEGLELPVLGAGAGDYDRDGDLDLALAQWGVAEPGDARELLWRNDGDRLRDAGRSSGLGAVFPRSSSVGPGRFVFSPSFSDLDGDGWPDLVLAADFGTSQVLRNDGVGGFVDATPEEVVTDENGMGSAIGDVDNDGDLDWFVSSVWDPLGPDGNWGTSGNRLYRNDGPGTGTMALSDVTDAAGVRAGDWGWGACFADVDLDGDLDLFHVNGWELAGSPFDADASRLFANDGQGRFAPVSAAWGVTDTGAGRGVVCFDADRDGDVDLFVANHSGPPSFFRNELDRRGGAADRHWLVVRLAGPPGNAHGIGARIRVETTAGSQVRELRAGSQFLSQAPAEAHFGLPGARRARVEVHWPDGSVSVRPGLRVDRVVVLRHPAG